jgi:hypothetical protein
MTALLTPQERHLIIEVLANTPIKEGEMYNILRNGFGGYAFFSDQGLFQAWVKNFGVHHTLDPYTEDVGSEAYQNGYETGITWDANWWPAGPDVFEPRSRLRDLTEEQVFRIRASHAKRYNWKQGFEDGLEERLKDKDFARWWKAQRGGKAARYVEPNNG